ncbi:hypothetical protein ANN_15617 [Periplaneta americana]|uniref:Uncharacterized protein n=1 Tax=Periplaneta americana TaxID=6978 RepID=A0ABQ8SH94_PERAM|nr:hypothetical protein ANN_15617 [Periplaneta americana]
MMMRTEPCKVVVITEDVQNVYLLLEYRPHIDVSLTCEHDPKLQEYCVCPDLESLRNRNVTCSEDIHNTPGVWDRVHREEQRLRVFENKVLRKIFGAKRDEVTGEWRKLHNGELHALYSSPDIIRNIKSRRLRWAGHVARMGESRNAYRVFVGRPEGKIPFGRPRRRWEDNIKIDLREVGYDEEEMIVRDMLLELNDSCEQYGMKINANKKKSVVIGRKVKKVKIANSK